MASTNSEEQVNYLLAVLATASEFKAGYQELAQAAGINNANNAQKKFKAIVEKSGDYKLVNGRVVPAGSGPAPPATPKKRKAKDDGVATPKTPASKRTTRSKKKASPTPEDDKLDSDNDVADESVKDEQQD